MNLTWASFHVQLACEEPWTLMINAESDMLKLIKGSSGVIWISVSHHTLYSCHSCFNRWKVFGDLTLSGRERKQNCDLFSFFHDTFLKSFIAFHQWNVTKYIYSSTILELQLRWRQSSSNNVLLAWFVMWLVPHPIWHWSSSSGLAPSTSFLHQRPLVGCCPLKVVCGLLTEILFMCGGW